MLFLKNIVRKKHFKNYIIILFILILSSLTLICINNYLTIRKNTIKNSRDNRTIIIHHHDDCNSFNIKYIEYCNSSEEETIIILNDVDNIHKFISDLEFEDYALSNIVDDSIDSLIKIVKYLIILFFVVIILILIIIIFIFVNDDFLSIKILRCIGYSKQDLLRKNLIIFILLITIIFLLSILISLIPILILKLKILELLKYVILEYILTILLTIIIYTLCYLFLNNHFIKS